MIVGFGAAGACAALEAAAAGRSVIILDRFNGGGATALSGGVVYAGGGTRQQRAAGAADSVDAMVAYLEQETGDVVSPATLRAFCERSAEMLSWLEGHGVPFDGRLYPGKTSYPGNRYYLYYSGSEQALSSAPAPRGHRTRGRGTSGKVFYARLARAVRAARVQVLPQTTAVGLVTSNEGRVVGVECRALHGALVRFVHRLLHRLSVKPYLYAPVLGRSLHRPVAWLEQRFGRPFTVRATCGVVLAAGGFGANRSMLRTHAPGSRGGLPLATPGDDGSGISLGREAGGDAGLLDRVSVWRFLTPPSAFVRGLLVDRAGRRIVDESRYGAAIGDAVLRAGGRAWLMVDAAATRLAWRQTLGRDLLWFQRLQALYLLVTRKRGGSVAAVAVAAGVDGAGLAATVAASSSGLPDEFGKVGAVPLDKPPYSLIDCSIRPRPFYPAPVLTLGGLVVNESTGQVLRPDGSGVPGLYAAGRTAIGLCSNSYVSGLSLADCVFSGRRAARSIAAAGFPPPTPAPAPATSRPLPRPRPRR